jgi:hypothetical protein
MTRHSDAVAGNAVACTQATSTKRVLLHSPSSCQLWLLLGACAAASSSCGTAMIHATANSIRRLQSVVATHSSMTAGQCRLAGPMPHITAARVLTGFLLRLQSSHVHCQDAPAAAAGLSCNNSNGVQQQHNRGGAGVWIHWH